MEKIRTFLSLNLDNKSAETIKSYQNELKKCLSNYDIKWEDPEKFHLTLRFLGNLRIENLEPLIFTCRRLSPDFDEIRYTTNGIGLFPGNKYPRVIFFSLNESGNNTESLLSLIDKIIFNFGVKPEKRFIPHITVGRFKKNYRLFQENFKEFQGIEINFSSFFLMKSILKPTGSVYEVIEEFKFNRN